MLFMGQNGFDYMLLRLEEKSLPLNGKTIQMFEQPLRMAA